MGWAAYSANSKEAGRAPTGPTSKATVAAVTDNRPDTEGISRNSRGTEVDINSKDTEAGIPRSKGTGTVLQAEATEADTGNNRPLGEVVAAWVWEVRPRWESEAGCLVGCCWLTLLMAATTVEVMVVVVMVEATAVEAETFKVGDEKKASVYFPWGFEKCDFSNLQGRFLSEVEG